MGGKADGLGDIAKSERLCQTRVTRTLCLAFLAPEITKAILEGSQPTELTAKRLEIGSSIQWPFLAILVFWLAVIFASFGLFAPRNTSVAAALFVAALSVAGSIYLILAMDQPYSGPIKISSASLRIALEQLGQP